MGERTISIFSSWFAALLAMFVFIFPAKTVSLNPRRPPMPLPSLILMQFDVHICVSVRHFLLWLVSPSTIYTLELPRWKHDIIGQQTFGFAFKAAQMSLMNNESAYGFNPAAYRGSCQKTNPKINYWEPVAEVLEF